MPLSTPTEQPTGDGQSHSLNDHAEEENVTEDHQSSSFVQIACQSCRLRKIRCDRKHPCTQCVRKHVECSFPALKPRERRRKALVSSSYEETLADISQKLDQLTGVVNNYTFSQGSRLQALAFDSATTIPSPETIASPQHMVEKPTRTTESEIEPALLAQAAFATSYVQQAFSDSASSDELALSLDRLCQDLREDQQVNRSLHVQQCLLQPGFDAGDMKMPPLELAISCIQKLRYSDSAIFVWTWDIDNIGQLLEYTTRVYTSKASFAELIIVNSNLSRLLPMCAPDNENTTSAQTTELEMHARQCQKNLENILSRLPFNLASNFDNVLALYQATIYAIDCGKTLTAWKYIAAAVQICQTLGYHREIALVPETIQQSRRRKRLVWMIVIFDKGLSLRMGQPSAIRNNEFTLQKLANPTQDDVSAIGPSSLLSKWIDFALLQGKIYDELYSPGALLQAQSIRATRAQQLAADLQRVFNADIPTETHFYDARRQALGDDTHRLFCGADRIHFLTTLILIYRVIPAGSESGSAFSEECIKTTIEALDEHQHCLPILRNAKASTFRMYIQWAFLSSPFIPYIVLFCRVFETCEPVYLEKLASIVEALCLLPQELPEANQHQLRIFQSMYNVAFKYLQANKHRQPRGCVLSSTDLDLIFRDIVIGGSFDVSYGECTTMDIVEP